MTVKKSDINHICDLSKLRIDENEISTFTKQISDILNMINELEMVYDINNDYELCLDEVGRGCMFGNVYIACVVLPKDNSFDKKDIKDSKKIKSKTKLNALLLGIMVNL